MERVRTRSVRALALLVVFSAVGATAVASADADRAQPRLVQTLRANFVSSPDECIRRFAGVSVSSEYPLRSEDTRTTTIQMAAVELDSCVDPGNEPQQPLAEVIGSFQMFGPLSPTIFDVTGNAQAATFERRGSAVNFSQGQSVPTEVRLQFTATDPVDPKAGSADCDGGADFARSGVAIGSITIDGVEYAPGPSQSASATRAVCVSSGQ